MNGQLQGEFCRETEKNVCLLEPSELNLKAGNRSGAGKANIGPESRIGQGLHSWLEDIKDLSYVAFFMRLKN